MFTSVAVIRGNMGRTGLFDFQFQVLLQYYSGSRGRNLKRAVKSTVQSGEKLNDEILSSATSALTQFRTPYLGYGATHSG